MEKSDRHWRRRLCKSERIMLLKRQKNKCYYCGIELKSTLLGDPDDGNHAKDWACVDHKISWSNGGKTDIKNCVMSCRSCNQSKWAYNHIEVAA